MKNDSNRVLLELLTSISKDNIFELIYIIITILFNNL